MAVISLVDPKPVMPTTAILVINTHSGPKLCPFFGKCEGILLVERNSVEIYHRARSEPLCDFILRLRPERLVCGYIGDLEKQRLHDAGIDVRLGSCACPIDELFVDFHQLPQA